MNGGVDVVARGLALKAGGHKSRNFADFGTSPVSVADNRVETTGHAQTGQGAGSYISDSLCDAQLLANHPDFAFAAEDGRIFRLMGQAGMIDADQAGAIADGVTNNSPALEAAIAYASACGIKTIRLGAGTYALTSGGGLNWTASGLSLIGQGVDQTVLRQIDHSITAGSALKMQSCANVVFQDLTLHGANGYGTLHVDPGQTIENVVFNRVKFTTDLQSVINGDWFSSTNGVRWVTDTGSARNIWFVDCVFENCGRMGIEFQNHGTGTTSRYGDIHILRPRFINIGHANKNAGYQAGMGISLSGYGENVQVEAPYFDNVAQICIEMVGCSRSKFTDIRVRYDTLGTALIQATNNREMHGNEIDGLRFVGPQGQPILGTPPSVPVNIRLDNWHKGVIRNCHLHTTGDKTLRLGVSYPSTGNLIEANDFTSDTGLVIENFQSAGNRYLDNRLISTLAGSALSGMVGVFGNSSTDCHFDGNIFEADAATSWNPIIMNGTATARFTGGNKLKGKKTVAQGTFVMATGTKYVSVDHGLGVTPTRYGITPKSRVYNSGSGDMVPYCGAASNVINAITVNNVSADATIHWWAEANHGNL